LTAAAPGERGNMREAPGYGIGIAPGKNRADCGQAGQPGRGKPQNFLPSRREAVSQIIRIGPQDARKPVSLNPGDLLEVILPEKNITGIWSADFDPALLWDGEEENRPAWWVLGEGVQHTVRTFQARAPGCCWLHFDYLDMHNGKGGVIESIHFNILIGPDQPRKRRPSEKTSPAAQPPSWRGEQKSPRRPSPSVSLDSQAKIQQLEAENRRLQERLWGLTHKLVELAEGYAALVKGKSSRSRP